MKILVNGACGRLGSALCQLLTEGCRGHTLAGAADIRAVAGSGVLERLAAFEGTADAVVDFSAHDAAGEVCAFCEKRRLPVVIATTGHTTAEHARIEQAALHIPVFCAANLSLGAAVLQQLACLAAALLPETDIEILEAHHAQKKDAPSGTALQLAGALGHQRGGAQAVYGWRRPRRAGEIGVHALRLGARAGMHSVLLADSSQTLTLTHDAHTLDCYLQGALAAAAFVATQPPGLYGMPQLLAARQARMTGPARFDSLFARAGTAPDGGRPQHERKESS